MDATYTQFIGVYKNAVPKEWCNKIITLFDKNSSSQISRLDAEKVPPLLKQDVHLKANTISPKIIQPFKNLLLHTLLPNYNNTYQFHPEEKIKIFMDDFKVQKTSPTEGYHVWHCENDDIEVSHRLLVYTIYLNDVKEGGETEFLYQSLRIPPKQGTVCIFPSIFTHTHRGNPPLTNTKYIATGWISYLPKKL